jgi:hypothetical protein
MAKSSLTNQEIADGVRKVLAEEAGKTVTIIYGCMTCGTMNSVLDECKCEQPMILLTDDQVADLMTRAVQGRAHMQAESKILSRSRLAKVLKTDKYGIDKRLDEFRAYAKQHNMSFMLEPTVVDGVQGWYIDHESLQTLDYLTTRFLGRNN